MVKHEARLKGPSKRRGDDARASGNGKRSKRKNCSVRMLVHPHHQNPRLLFKNRFCYYTPYPLQQLLGRSLAPSCRDDLEIVKPQKRKMKAQLCGVNIGKMDAMTRRV